MDISVGLQVQFFLICWKTAAFSLLSTRSFAPKFCGEGANRRGLGINLGGNIAVPVPCLSADQYSNK